MLFRQLTPHHNQTNIAMQMKLPEIAQFLVLALYCVAAAAFGSLEANVKSKGLLVIFILVIHSLKTSKRRYPAADVIKGPLM